MDAAVPKDFVLMALVSYNSKSAADVKLLPISKSPPAEKLLDFEVGERFRLVSSRLKWWIFVERLSSKQQGFIPSVLVVPLKEELDADSYWDQPTSLIRFSKKELKYFPLISKEIGDRVELEPCGETGSSVFSRLTFQFMNRFMLTGFRRPLVDSDIWNARPDLSMDKLYPRFCKVAQKVDLQKSRINASLALSVVPPDGQVEADPSAEQTQDSAKTQLVSKGPSSPINGSRPGRSFLFRVILSFCWEAVFGGFILKLIHDALQFTNPIILGLLTNFADNNDNRKYIWKGYVYALLLFLVPLAQTLFLHQYFHIIMIGSMKVRCSVTSFIYQKMLRLSSKGRQASTVGEMMNRMSVDCMAFQDMFMNLHLLWSCPLQIVIAMVLLYQQLGYSMFAGVAVIVLLLPLNYFVSAGVRRHQAAQLKNSDLRMKLVNQVLSGIKLVKLYSWEKPMMEIIGKIRLDELKNLRRVALLNSIGNFMFYTAPNLVSMAAFVCYVLVGNELTATKVFVSMSLFNILRFPMNILPTAITAVIQMFVSMRRVEGYLDLDELQPGLVERLPYDKDETAVSVINASFTWDKPEKPFLSNINISVEPGKLVAIVGQVGSGKSSLISAMLGDMPKINGHITLRGKVAYLSQQAWIQNSTVRKNILIGQKMDKKVYNDVIDRCCLKPDFQLLSAGDLTEIGEKGINLSGGQKQRIAMARAVFFNADVYLFDDPLSALDAHVGKSVFTNVISKTGLLKDKTRVLVTNDPNILESMDQIIVLKNGLIAETGSYSELMAANGLLSELVQTYTQTEVESKDLPEVENEEDKESSNDANDKDEEAEGKGEAVIEVQEAGDDVVVTGDEPFEQRLSKENLARGPSWVLKRRPSQKGSTTAMETKRMLKQGEIIKAESIATGTIRAAIFMRYFRSLGVFFYLMALFFILTEGSITGQRMWLAKWSVAVRSGTNETTTEINPMTYLWVYIGLVSFSSLFAFFATISAVIGCYRAGKQMHATLLEKVMHYPMSFFDTTPTGRLISRFSHDMNSMDNQLPTSLRSVAICSLSVLGVLVLITYSSVYFLIGLLPIAIIYVFTQRVYVACSRQLQRLDSARKSPILSHFLESILGSATIRAFGLEEHFKSTNISLVNASLRVYYLILTGNRWLAVRLELVGNLIIFFSALTGVISFHSGQIVKGVLGLAVSSALQVTQTLNWLVRVSGDLENNLVSVERIRDFCELPEEAAWYTTCGKEDEGFITNGKVEFRNYSTKYRKELDLVLRSLSLTINAGERVGVVGRTGAGKSSLALALFRIIEPTEGTILIDGHDITKLGLQVLRSSISLIPQDPFLFAGTLRTNLDPFLKYDDTTLWRALEVAHLKKFVEDQKDSLDMKISEDGSNLSVGQRQLVCLARAVLRKTRILVLDEATASVDPETDELIQKTVRQEFAGCTIVAIAHRLNTIMDYDRVMVLDHGTVAELDSPQELLKMEGGIFRAMAKDAGLSPSD